MKFQYFLSVLVLLCVTGCSISASIADTVTVDEVHIPQQVSDVVEEGPVHYNEEEVITLEVESPKMTEEEEVLPHDEDVEADEENAEKPELVVDKQLVERAERQADEDLVKALGSVLTKRETIEDVIRTEQVAIPQL